MQVEENYKVVVEKIISKGIIVRLENDTTEFIHLSNISSDYVDNPNKFVSIGDTYEAKAVQGKARPVELSLKHLNLQAKKLTTDNLHRTQSPSKSSKLNKSLDEMIADAEQSYMDKVSNLKSNRPEYSYSKQRRKGSSKRKKG